MHEPSAGKDGWTDWQRPVMRGYRLGCCDCGLVHDIDFRVVRIVKRHDHAPRRAKSFHPKLTKSSSAFAAMSDAPDNSAPQKELKMQYLIGVILLLTPSEQLVEVGRHLQVRPIMTGQPHPTLQGEAEVQAAYPG